MFTSDKPAANQPLSAASPRCSAPVALPAGWAGCIRQKCTCPNADGDFYPLAERATAWADQAPAPLVGDVRAYTGGRLDDDMAMVVLQRDRTAS